MTGISAVSAGEQAIEEAVKKAGYAMDDLAYIVTTGYGRRAVSFGQEAITEITCHSVGAKWLIPTVRVVIDIGGQDSKVIELDEIGNVANFVMNDKCAAGTGRFLEVIASALEIGLENLATFSLNSNRPSNIDSTCTVFAESEVISLRAQKEPTENIIAGIHKSIARRVAAMGSASWYRDSVVLTGGVGKNTAVKKALEEQIRRGIIVPEEPQIVGALGAALIARERMAQTR